MLHLRTVRLQRRITAQQFVEISVCRVVVMVCIPVLQCQGCHGNLVAYIQDDIVVGIKVLAPPGYLCGIACSVECHERGGTRHVFREMKVEVADG